MEDIIASTGNIFERFPLLKYQMHFAVNGSALCVALNNSNECKEGDILVAVGYHKLVIAEHRYYDNSGFKEATNEFRNDYLVFQGDLESDHYLWSVIYQLKFEISEHKNMSLCEKSVVHAAVVADCSEYYMSCHEGTCIHDSLVCDGHSHCPHGEDEADCQHICSDHSHNCMSHCHHRDLCFCSLEFFSVFVRRLCTSTETM